MKWLWLKINGYWKWILGILIPVALAAPLIIPVDETGFDVHKDNIRAKFVEQVENASSTLPYSMENATFRKYTKENSSFLEIGDKTKDVFVPEFTITNWKETKFKVSIPTKVKPENQIVDFITEVKENATSSKLKWTDGNIDAVFYELDNGDFEFEYILKSIPESNVIEIDIETEGLDFFYQPALTQKEIDEGAFRPENVIGSYAVYHKTQSGDQSALGGANYKTGKAFHIYRPKIIDANGDWVWADQNINTTTKKWKITIPLLWLNSATYPVKF